jgi:hypothetical protein
VVALVVYEEVTFTVTKHQIDETSQITAQRDEAEPADGVGVVRR